MKKKLIIFISWFILVALWNYGYQEASPFEDVLAAVAFSLLSALANRKIK